MKVVACEKCGAKYQIDNEETVDNYECSVCAGNLNEIEEYPSTYSSINQNHGNNLYESPYDPNSQIVYCENCGLKHTIDKREYSEDYECSSCFGNLRYIDEDLNKDLDRRLKLKYQQINSNSNINPNSEINPNSNPNITTNSEITPNSNPNINPNSEVDPNFHSVDPVNQRKSLYSKDSAIKNRNNDPNTNSDSFPHSESNTISPAKEMNVNKVDEKLREQIKNEFYKNLASEYGDLPKQDLKNDNNIQAQKIENIEDEIRKKLEEKNSRPSIFNRITNLGREKNKDEFPENIAIDKEIAELTNSSTAKKEINELVNNNKKQDLVPYPNIKNTSYHDVYIVAGLIIALVGFADILLSKRIYSIIFVAIGFILFGIGIIKNQNYTATEKRGRIIREKLLSLPESFYVLYFVKVPDANYGINHVVVGASGIFAIVSQSFKEKEDKKKPLSNYENIKLMNKLDNLDITGISDIVDAANNNYENNKKIEEAIKKKHEKIEPKKEKVGKFKFRERPVKFEHNDKIKQKSIKLSEMLIDFLNENGLSDCYVEPLVGFVNNDVAIINMPLTDNDLFLDELLYKIVHGRRELDDVTTHKVAVLLSQYSTECSS